MSLLVEVSRSREVLPLGLNSCSELEMLFSAEVKSRHGGARLSESSDIRVPVEF